MVATSVAVALVGLAASASANHNSFSYVSAGARKGSGPFDANFAGASADGTKVFFYTNEQLTNDDTDQTPDIYQRAGGVTTLISKGQINGNGAFFPLFRAASADGSRVFFGSSEKLTSDDTDDQVDVYERSGGATTRVSKGNINGNGSFSADFGGISTDGTVVFFTTGERLTGDDSDDQFDVYKRAGGVTEKISKSSLGGNGASSSSFFGGASADGSRAFFGTDEKLSTFDFDNGFDVYERSGGKTTLISEGGFSDATVVFVAASADGTHVLFETDEQLTADDNDTLSDLYERFGGTTTLVTKRTDSETLNSDFLAISSDGNHVFFETREFITDDDGDSWMDVFEYAGGGVTRVSQGEPGANDTLSDSLYCGIAANGTRVFFATGDPLTSDDMNGRFDVFERVGGMTTRISKSTYEAGSGGGAFCAGASDDGSHVFFVTDIQLAPEDVDATSDVYERFAGMTKLISKGNGAFSTSFEDVSANGDRVVYGTPEAVTADDTDTSRDLYQRVGSTTSRLSDGEPKGNGPFAASVAGSSTDGARLFFTTAEQLTSDDTDASVDLYQRAGTTTTRVSAGAVNGQGPYGVTFRAASGDGTKVLFTTNEQLTTDDADGVADIYRRSAGTTTLVSPGEINGFIDAVTFAGASADGNTVFFTSPEQLTFDDFDLSVDLFQWQAGLTRRLSQGPSGGNAPVDVAFRGASTNGSKVFFSTAEKLVSDDTDSAVDVYQWSAAVTTRLSQGPTGGNANVNATFAGASADGSKVFFTTGEKLTSDDLDGSADLYQRVGTTTTRLSIGNGAFPVTFVGSSTDGTRVFFTTAEKLTGDDTDSQLDIYERTASTTTRVSQGQINGNNPFAAIFARVSSNGASVFFTTAERLTDDDSDSVIDLYRRASGNTIRMSQGQVNGNGPFPVAFRGISADGSRVFFTSDEVLSGDDTDTKTDVYERFGGTTYRISGSSALGNAAFPAVYRAASSDGKRVFFETAEKLAGADVDGATDIYSAAAP